jgi:hypothetical protein
MHEARRKHRRLIVTIIVAAAAATIALTVPSASGSATSEALFAYVVPTNAGPLPSCSGSDCTPANTVYHFIRVLNANRLTNLENGTNRATVPNAYAIDSIDEQIFVDGVEHQEFAFTFTPPPNPSYRPYSGHWPSTATCPPEGPPCNVIDRPAILPGENTTALYVGWVHGTGEPNGTYVFRFTIHGTLNGTPVDLRASSPPIEMTP